MGSNRFAFEEVYFSWDGWMDGWMEEGRIESGSPLKSLLNGGDSGKK